LLLIVGLQVRPAQAAFAVCRGDPIVALSNGLTLRMAVEIEAPGSEVGSVIYTLHAPPGVYIRSIAYTGGELRLKEIVRLVNDAPAGTYRTDTVVKMLTPSVAGVLAHVDGKRVDSQAYGLTGEILSVTLTP
jgi:hypothetical protein